ncbi:MAG: phosphoribosylformylglycinamidine synthase subunit PurQ, partial [Clostridia bacterium]
ENAAEFLTLASSENLEATIVAEVTQNPRLVMNWNGNEIVNLSREFINSNGASKSTDIFVDSPKFEEICCNGNKTFTEKITALVSDLNICSKKGLSERFDSTIGASTVLMPFGGKYQMTPIQAMVAKIPLEKADTTTCSVMAYGFDPYLSSQSPYHGAICAVVESVAKVVAAGGDHEMCWLSFQEYFERTKNDPKRWGKPFSALLGSFEAQLGLGVAAIGGKDSMSGTFEEIDVPPTLISFAVSVANSKEVCSPEFKKINSNVYYIAPKYDEKNLPCFESVKDVFSCVKNLIKTKKATSVYAVSAGGIGEAVFKMSLGNKIGFQFNNSLSKCEIFKKCYGGFIVETNEEIAQGILIGKTTIDYNLKFNDEKVCLQSLQKSWENKLESVFPAYKEVENKEIPKLEYSCKNIILAKNKVAKPKVLIPVFPGTNCEYDSAKVFKNAETDIFVIKNLTSNDIKQSVSSFAEKIKQSQIIMLPGGFSGGDEPEGSAKFIVSFFSNPQIMEAVSNHLENNDGLMLGICNGFQALIKLGLVPYGKIMTPKESSPTLTFNAIGR